MHETVQIWFTEPCNVKGIWFKALNFFILVMAVSAWIRKGAIVWLSLPSGSFNWVLLPKNQRIFNSTFKGGSSFWIVKPLSAMIESLLSQKFLFSIPHLFTISLSDINPSYISLKNVITPEGAIPSSPL